MNEALNGGRDLCVGFCTYGASRCVCVRERKRERLSKLKILQRNFDYRGYFVFHYFYFYFILHPPFSLNFIFERNLIGSGWKGLKPSMVLPNGSE